MGLILSFKSKGGDNNFTLELCVIQVKNLTISKHIFHNDQVTSRKMVHKKGHHFLTQFSMPFHVACFVLLQVLASKTIE